MPVSEYMLLIPVFAKLFSVKFLYKFTDEMSTNVAMETGEAAISASNFFVSLAFNCLFLYLKKIILSKRYILYCLIK